eukprot:7604571-Karenia_brevis.AAC.1
MQIRMYVRYPKLIRGPRSPPSVQEMVTRTRASRPLLAQLEPREFRLEPKWLWWLLGPRWPPKPPKTTSKTDFETI